MQKKQFNVLLVEDDQKQMKAFFLMLKQFGFKITTCDNGRKAYEIIHQGNRFNLILMDYIMPEMDGIEAMKKIKAIDKTIPIILMSANYITSEICPVLRKPFTKEELNTVMSNLN